VQSFPKPPSLRSSSLKPIPIIPEMPPGRLRAKRRISSRNSVRLRSFSLKPIPIIPEVAPAPTAHCAPRKRRGASLHGSLPRLHVFMQTFPKLSQFSHLLPKNHADAFHKLQNSSLGRRPRPPTRFG
jgi:hypothetical protein